MASAKHIVRNAKAARTEGAKPSLFHRVLHSKALKAGLTAAALAGGGYLLHRRADRKAEEAGYAEYRTPGSWRWRR